MAFRGLQAESIAQGEAHKAAGKELESLVADPFEQWAVGHASRIRDSGASLLDGWLRTYELALGDVCFKNLAPRNISPDCPYLTGCQIEVYISQQDAPG
jgi:hypothetical protein